MNAIRHLERDRLYPGAVAQALRQWRLGVGNPSHLLNPHPCCDPGLGRGCLEIALHALPKHAARELRALLLPLDDRYLARIPPNPTMPPTAPWWERHQWAVR